MFYKSHKKSASRAFDHLYDPLYIVPHRRDIQRENVNALIRTAPINIYPVYDTMFTDLPQKRRVFLTLQQNPLPVDPYLKEKSISTSPAQHIRTVVNLTNYVNVPISNIKTLNLKLDIRNKYDTEDYLKKVTKTKTSSVACQTLYREQSAQTKPYLPTHRIDTEQTPMELLQLATKYPNDHHPPGWFQIKRLEREKKTLGWEKAVNDLTARANWNKKRLLMEAIEFENWLLKQEEIDDCQLQRLDIVKGILNKNVDNNKQIYTDVATDSVDRLAFERNEKLHKIHNQYKRSIRRLKAKKSSLNESNIPSNDLCEPKRTLTTSIEKYKSAFLQHYVNFEDVELRREDISHIIHPENRLDKPKTVSNEIYVGFTNESNLQNIYEFLRASRLEQFIRDSMVKCLKSIKRNELMSHLDIYSEMQHTLSELLQLATQLNEITQDLNIVSRSKSLDSIEKQLQSVLNTEKVNRCQQDRELNLEQDGSRAKNDDSRMKDFECLYENVLTTQNNAITFHLENLFAEYLSEMGDNNGSVDELGCNSSEIITDLIDNFIWPEICKTIENEN